MQDAYRRELLRLGDLTLADVLRLFARYDGTVLEQDGLLLFAGPHPQPSPFRNGALRLDARLSAEEVVDRGREFFAPRRRNFVMWVREHEDGDLAALLEREAVRELERIPGTVLDRPPESRPLPEGIELRRTTDEATRLDFLRVNADAWGMPDLPLEAAAGVFFHPDVAAAPHVAAVVAYRGDEPLSCAMAVASHGVGWFGESATVPGARRLGLAQITHHAAVTTCMEELGARRIHAQSRAAGLSVWTGMGYVPVTAFRRLIVPSASRNGR
jgi:hypothetical protein